MHVLMPNFEICAHAMELPLSPPGIMLSYPDANLPGLHDEKIVLMLWAHFVPRLNELAHGVDLGNEPRTGGQ